MTRLQPHRSRAPTGVLRLLCLLAMIVIAPGMAAAQRGTVWVRGRLLLPDGTGAKGAIVSLSKRDRLPGGWSQKAVRSDPVEVGLTGGFSISYVPGLYEECVLTAKLEGQMPLEWSWTEHPSQGSRVLPARIFAEACYASGSVVGRDGELLTEGWRVVATAQGDRLSYQAASYAPFTLDSGTGDFRIGPLPAGPAEFYALHNSGARTEVVNVSLQAEDPPHVVLSYAGPGLDSSVRIHTYSATCPGIGLGGSLSAGPSADEPIGEERSYLFLLDSDGSVITEAIQPHGIYGMSWWFADVPPGEYAVELRHPKFDPVRLERVMTGSTCDVQLVGSADIQLEVVSKEGMPVEDYELEIRYGGKSSQTRPCSVLAPGQPAPKDGRYDGIVPGNAELFVKDAGGGITVVELGFLEPGETRHVRAQLAGTLPMDLLVVDERGVPVEGLLVLAAMGTVDALGAVEEAVRQHMVFSVRSGPEGLDRVFRTDAEGRVTVRKALPGRWAVKAVASNLAGVTRTLVHPLPEDGPIVLQLPVLGRLEGQLLSTEGFDWSSIRLAARLVQEDGTYGPSQEWCRVNRKGAFELAGLPVGNLVFVCSLIDSTLPYGDRESLLVSESAAPSGGSWISGVFSRPPAPYPSVWTASRTAMLA